MKNKKYIKNCKAGKAVESKTKDWKMNVQKVVWKVNT